jgi:TRAP-type C4-dicarboxylate transport system permease small subunit
MPRIELAQLAESNIQRLSRIAGIIAIGILVGMMLFTVLDVFLRAVFNRPLPGSVDVIEIGMVAVGFLGLSLCAMREMHVKVDLVVSLLPKRAQRIIVSFGYLIGLGICILLSWQAFQEGIAVRELNTLSSTLEIPVFPFYWVVALGFALLCLAILVFLARSLTQAIKG